MRRQPCYLASLISAACFVLALAVVVWAGEFRIWTDDTGKHTREAALEKLDGDVVYLRSKEGRELKIPIAKLSKADQSYARNATSEQGDPFQESAQPAAQAELAVKEVAAEDETESDDPSLRVVIAEGSGVNVEKAKKDAYREAVRLVVGAFVDSSQLLKNDELIEDRIITLSSAYVEKASQPLTKVSKDGLIQVKVRAWVRATKVLETLKTANVELKVDNTSFTAELQTRADQSEGEEALMSRVFAAYPANSFTISLVGKPQIAKAANAAAAIRIAVKLQPDLEQYLVVAQKIEAALGSTGREGGEFSVDGKSFPSNSIDDTVGYWFKHNGAIYNTQSGLLTALPAADHPRLKKEEQDDGRCGSVEIPNLFHLWPADEDTNQSGGLDGLARGKWEKLRPVDDTHVVFLIMTKSNTTGQRTRWRWFLLAKDEARRWFAPACKKMLCTLSFLNNEKGELLEDRFSFSKIGWQVLNPGSRRQYVYVCAPAFIGGDGTWYAPSFTYTRQIEADTSEVEGLASVKCSLVNGNVVDEVWGVTD